MARLRIRRRAYHGHQEIDAARRARAELGSREPPAADGATDDTGAVDPGGRAPDADTPPPNSPTADPSGRAPDAEPQAAGTHGQAAAAQPGPAAPASAQAAPAGAQPSGDAPQRRRMDYRPVGTDPRTGAWPTFKRTVLEFNEDNMTDWAAALTYYGLLALFPALIALVSIVGLFGDPEATTDKLTEIVTAVGPDTAADTFRGPIESITSNRGAAGVLLIGGLALALWSASGYIGAFSRASNVIYETPEGRPFWKLRPLQMLIALVMVLLLAALALALVMTGPIVDEIAEPLGIGSTAVTIWNIAKWPVMLAVVVLIVGVLYHATPNVKLPGFKWVTPGAVVAIVVWLVASAAFAFYVSNFGSYDKTYGALGGVIVLLIWLWITNLALLFGMELNAERERSRELDAGVPGAERELQLDARDEPKRQRTT